MEGHFPAASAVVLGLSLLGMLGEPAAPLGYGTYPVEARIWLDLGEEPILRRGERVRIYYRVSQNAYVAVFHIDTNGTARLLFPGSPQEDHFARGARDYRLLVRGASSWFVNEDPGVGYFFIVASPEPFDFRRFGYSRFSGGWDLTVMGRQVYRDPYLAMDDYVAALIPDWEVVGYALDFAVYHVEGHYDFPRFLCYDCHGFRPYWSWNPYAYTCSTFRLVIYTDPYYYPSTRYRNTRVVYAQPWRGAPQFVFKERAVGEGGAPQKVVRGTPPTSQPGVAGAELRRTAAGGAVEVLRTRTTPGGSTSGAPLTSVAGAGGRGGGTEVGDRVGGGGAVGPSGPSRPSDPLRRAGQAGAGGVAERLPGPSFGQPTQSPPGVRPVIPGVDAGGVRPARPSSSVGGGGDSPSPPGAPGLFPIPSGSSVSAPRPVLERRPVSGGASSGSPSVTTPASGGTGTGGGGGSTSPAASRAAGSVGGKGGTPPPPAGPQPSAKDRPPAGGASLPPPTAARRPGGGG